MDPDTNLAEQLKLTKRLLACLDKGKPVDEDDVDQLCTLVEGLDGWLKAEGFLPKRWRRSVSRLQRDIDQAKR
jgi:hypothetical protein